MKRNIAILGSGKFALALVRGFLKSGTPPQSILVIGREKSNLTNFEAIQVGTSKSVEDAVDIPHILVVVKPEGIGPQMKRIKEAGLKQTIICLSSGANIHDCAAFLGRPDGDIIIGTGNTNVEHCTGIICLSGTSNKNNQLINAKTLFSPTATVAFEKQEDILKSVATIGAWNAFDALALELIGKKETVQKSVTFDRWLTNIESWLASDTVFETKVVDPHKELLGKYLITKNDVLSRVFGYSKQQAQKRSLETFESCVSALRAIDNIDVDKIKLHIKKVATEGGCTEKGLLSLGSIDALLSFEQLSNALHLVYERTKRFEDEAKQSFE